jgi:hypothetical protein
LSCTYIDIVAASHLLRRRQTASGGWGDFRSSCTGLVEEIAVFLGQVAFEGAAGLLQSLARTLGTFAQRRPQFGEGLLDRVEVGAVWRQVEEVCDRELFGGPSPASLGHH